MAALPIAAGSVLSGMSMNRLGRKTTNLLICVPFVLGWTSVSMATGVTGVYAGRLLTGLCTGLLGPPAAVYIAEVTEPQYRGAALATISFSVSAGILAVHAMGTFLGWWLVSALCSVVPFVGYTLIWFTPESPVWLRNNGLAERAERAARRLTAADRRKPESPPAAGPNASAADDGSRRAPAPPRPGVAAAVVKPTARQCFGRPSFLRPLAVLSAFFFVQQFSGVNAVAFYSVTLLKRVSPDLNEYHCTMALDVIRLLVSVLACALTKRYGRRPLAVVSAVGTCASLLCLAASVRDPGPATDAAFAAVHAVPAAHATASLTPVLSIVSYMVFVNIGLVPLPWIMSGEVSGCVFRVPNKTRNPIIEHKVSKYHGICFLETSHEKFHFGEKIVFNWSSSSPPPSNYSGSATVVLGLPVPYVHTSSPRVILSHILQPPFFGLPLSLIHRA